jgi:hypothetical protein
MPPFRSGSGSRSVTRLCLEQTTSGVMRLQGKRKEICASRQFTTLRVRHLVPRDLSHGNNRDFFGERGVAQALDGVLDPAFGAVSVPTFQRGGRVMTDFDHSTDIANAAAVQADGKLVVVGAFDSDRLT